MSECVVRMKNPDDCLKCGVRHICNPYVDYWQQDTRKKPEPGQKGCLIFCSLPDGHGRLVEESDVIRLINKWFDTIGLNPDIMIDGIKSLPTIVPADTAERSEA